MSALPVASPGLRALAGAQRALREHLADVVDRSASGGAAVPALVGLARAYGLLHALGPGHRKMALAAVYGLYYLFRGSVSAAFSSLSWILELGSHGAITLLGLVLLALSIRGRLRSRRGGHGACGGPARGDRTLAAVVLGSGVVPCPDTALILCLSQGLPWIGALAVSACMAAVIVVFGLFMLAPLSGRPVALGVILRQIGPGYGWLSIAYLMVLGWIVATLCFQLVVEHSVDPGAPGHARGHLRGVPVDRLAEPINRPTRGAGVAAMLRIIAENPGQDMRGRGEALAASGIRADRRTVELGILHLEHEGCLRREPQAACSGDGDRSGGASGGPRAPKRIQGAEREANGSGRRDGDRSLARGLRPSPRDHRYPSRGVLR